MCTRTNGTHTWPPARRVWGAGSLRSLRAQRLDPTCSAQGPSGPQGGPTCHSFVALLVTGSAASPRDTGLIVSCDASCQLQLARRLVLSCVLLCVLCFGTAQLPMRRETFHPPSAALGGCRLFAGGRCTRAHLRDARTHQQPRESRAATGCASRGAPHPTLRVWRSPFGPRRAKMCVVPFVFQCFPNVLATNIRKSMTFQ